MASTAALGHEDLVVLVVSDVHHAMDNCAKLHDWLQQNPRKYAAANALPRLQSAIARPRDSLPFTWPIVLVACVVWRPHTRS